MSRSHFCYMLLVVSLASGAGQIRGASLEESEIQDTLQQRIIACTVCHGKQGEGLEKAESYFPRIGGKPAGYLYRQLLNFREGRRRYPPMNDLVSYLPDAYLMEIAQYFASQHPAYPPPAPPKVSQASLRRAETLITKGDPSKGVPACVACHGKTLTGSQPAIPGLVGLPPYYIVAQLGAWQSGIRRADTPDCMAKIASHLSLDDISALAAWLAAQPVSEDMPPAPAGLPKLPLDCGSVH